jgi:electron transfer flavoprotein alpha subunit
MTPNFIPEIFEEIILDLQEKEKFTHIISNHTTFGKQIIPKLGAKLDVQPIT